MPKYKSRLDKRAKKKSNVVLNSLIGIVVLLIVVVGATIFLGNDTEPAAGDNTESTSNEVADSSDSNNEEETEDPSADTSSSENEVAANEDASTEDDSEADNAAEDEDDNKPVADGEGLAGDEKQDEKDKKEEKDSSDDKKKIVKDSNAPNVKKEIVNPGWKPIGTQQTGEHVAEYKENSADWQEKVQALSYATGLPEDNMTVWWLERNGGPDKAIGTVAPKDKSTTYRVYLEWIDGKGWKPVKMEELIENDKD
jgi:Sec-independent protein translocase protein TatA